MSLEPCGEAIIWVETCSCLVEPSPSLFPCPRADLRSGVSISDSLRWRSESLHLVRVEDQYVVHLEGQFCGCAVGMHKSIRTAVSGLNDAVSRCPVVLHVYVGTSH